MPSYRPIPTKIWRLIWLCTMAQAALSQGPLVRIASDDAVASEPIAADSNPTDQANIRITTLNAPSGTWTQNVIILLQTDHPNDATPGLDYQIPSILEEPPQAAPFQFAFTMGTTQPLRSFTIIPKFDTQTEQDKQIRLKLQLPENSLFQIDPTAAEVTITLQEALTLRFEGPPARQIQEPQTQALAIPMSLNRPAPTPIDINLTLSGNASPDDYLLSAQPDSRQPLNQLHIPAGSQSTTLYVHPLDDPNFEAPETLLIQLESSAHFRTDSGSRSVLIEPLNILALRAQDERMGIRAIAPGQTLRLTQRLPYQFALMGDWHCEGSCQITWTFGSQAGQAQPPDTPGTPLALDLNLAQLASGELEVTYQSDSFSETTSFQLVQVPQPEAPTPPSSLERLVGQQLFQADQPGAADLYYDLAALGLMPQAGNAVNPQLQIPGTYRIPVYRFQGDPENPADWVFSEAAFQDLVVRDRPSPPQRLVLPWFAVDRRLEDPNDPDSMRFTSVLALNNPTDRTITGLIWARRHQGAQLETHPPLHFRLPPHSHHLFVPAEDGFLNNVAHPHFGGNMLWETDGPGATLMIESQQTGLRAGLATYSGSRPAKPSSASPSQTAALTPTDFRHKLVLNAIPDTRAGAFAALVVTQQAAQNATFKATFHEASGAVIDLGTFEVGAFAPRTIPLSGLGPGYALIEALQPQTNLGATLFSFNDAQEPAMTTAEPFPLLQGPSIRSLPWVSYNLGGGNGLGGNFVFLSELIVANLAQETLAIQLETHHDLDTPPLSALKRLAPGQVATWTLGPTAEGDFLFPQLVGRDGSFSVALRGSHGQFSAALRTRGGNHPSIQKPSSDSPALAVAAQPDNIASQLLFNLANDPLRANQIDSFLIVANLGQKPVSPQFSLFGSQGPLRSTSGALFQDLAFPGGPLASGFSRAFNPLSDAGKTHLLSLGFSEADIAQLAQQPFSAIVTAAGQISGMTFLNSPAFRETAIASALRVGPIQMAYFEDPAIVEGQPIALRLACDACTAVDVQLESSPQQTLRLRPNQFGRVDLQPEDFPLTQQATPYRFHVTPLIGDQPQPRDTRYLDLWVQASLAVDPVILNAADPDESQWTLDKLQQVTQLDLTAPTTLRGLGQLKNLQHLVIRQGAGEDPNLNLAALHQLRHIAINGLQQVSRVTLPEAPFVTLSQMPHTRYIQVDATAISSMASLGDLDISDMPALHGLQLEQASLTGDIFITAHDNPTLTQLALPERPISSSGYPQFFFSLDLSGSGIETLDNQPAEPRSQEPGDSTFNLNNSLLNRLLPLDILVVDHLSPQGCQQAQSLALSGVIVIAESDCPIQSQ